MAKKRLLESNVYEAAIERVYRCYELFDNVAVMFSGGKDSTAALNVTLTVARDLDRLPVRVIFWDEEAIFPQTEDYVRRVSQSPEVELEWLCLPVQHRNGCSRKVPYWYPFDPACPDLWTRPIPPEGITHLNGFNGHTIPDASHLLFDPKKGTHAEILGIRAQESMMRLRSVTNKKNDNWFSWAGKHYAKCKPIYDWDTEDVWIAPEIHGWDYNDIYDVMDNYGMARHVQRIAPPYGEEPMQNLHMYQVICPELWDKMERRVHGSRTAARYSNSMLYGFGSRELPEGVNSWRDMIPIYLKRHRPDVRNIAKANIKQCVDMHYHDTKDPIPEDAKHKISGVSWKWLAMIAQRGDVKGRKKPFWSAESVDEWKKDKEQ